VILMTAHDHVSTRTQTPPTTISRCTLDAMSQIQDIKPALCNGAPLNSRGSCVWCRIRQNGWPTSHRAASALTFVLPWRRREETLLLPHVRNIVLICHVCIALWGSCDRIVDGCDW
jgi:hypothetical protein